MRKYYWEAPKNAPKAKTGNHVAKAQHGFFNKLETTDHSVLPVTKALSKLERARLQRAKSKVEPNQGLTFILFEFERPIGE